ncbi:MAG: hypothetical protein KAS93_02420 [Gammaproteobacteria bacterium]|nr:hypothetical protein [Gammaproteobacteria bacterium]
MRGTVVGLLALFLIGWVLISGFVHFQKYLLKGQSKVDGPFTTLTNSADVGSSSN